MKVHGCGISSIQPGIQNKSIPITFSEYALYLSVFLPAVYYGGVRFELIPLIQAILLVAYLLDTPKREKMKTHFQSSSFFFLLFLFTVWLFIRSISCNYFVRGIQAFEVYITALLVFLTVIHLSSNPRRRQRSLLIIFFFSTLLSMFHFYVSYYEIDARSSLIHFLSHGFHFHGYAILMIGIGMGIFLFSKNMKMKIISFLTTFIQVLSVLYYGKSGGIIGFFVLFSMMVYLLARSKGLIRKVQFVIIVFLILLNLLVFIGFQPIISELQTVPDHGAFSRWYYIYQGTIKMFLDNILIGVGLGKFSYFFPPYRNPFIDATPQYAHSEPLHFITEIGIIGGLLAIGLLIAYIKNLSQHKLEKNRSTLSKEGSRKQTRKNPYDYVITVGARAGLIGFSAICITDFELHIPANAFLFAYLLGELFLLESTETSERKQFFQHFSSQLENRLRTIKILLFPILIIIAHNVLLTISFYQLRITQGKVINKHDEMLELLSSTVSLYPINPETYFKRGEVYLNANQNHIVHAIKDFDTAIQLAPDNGKYYYYRGLCAVKQFHRSEAIGYFSQAIERDPQNILFLFERGRCYYQDDQADLAMNDFKHIVSINGRFLKQIFEFLRQYTNNLSQFSYLIPNSLNSKLIFAEYLLRNDENITANQLLNELIDSDNQSISNLNSILNIVRRYKQKALIQKSLSTIIHHEQFSPKDASQLRILYDYMRISLGNKEYEGIFHYLNNLIKIHPEVPELFGYLGQVQNKREGVAKQIEILKQALILHGNSGYLYNQLASAYYRQRDYLEAIHNFRLACQYDPREVKYQLSLASIYMKRDMDLSARKTLEKILDKHPQNISALRLMRKLYQDTHQKKKELHIVEKILEIKPTDKQMIARKKVLMNE